MYTCSQWSKRLFTQFCTFKKCYENEKCLRLCKKGIVNFLNCIVWKNSHNECKRCAVLSCAVSLYLSIVCIEWNVLLVYPCAQAINIKRLNILMDVLKVIFVDGKSHIWCKVIDVLHFFWPLRCKLMRQVLRKSYSIHLNCIKTWQRVCVCVCVRAVYTFSRQILTIHTNLFRATFHLSKHNGDENKFAFMLFMLAVCWE